MAAFGAPKVTSKSTLAAVASAVAASAVAASAPLLAEAAPPPGYARNRERLPLSGNSSPSLSEPAPAKCSGL